MDYGKVLSRAWEITWRWKILWILGFLASLGQGWGGSGNVNYSTDTSDWGYNFQNYVPPEVWALIAGIICLAILIGIALWVISIMARGGLIAGVQQVEEEGSTTFRQAWRVGVKRFWTLFGISVLTALPLLILVIVGIVVFGLLVAGTVGAIDRAAEIGGALGGVSLAICGGVFCCGMIILVIVLEQIRVYAERAAILEGMGWIEAFGRGWQVIKENLGPTIIYWLIFLVIGLIFGAIIFAGVMVLVVPLIALVSNTDPGAWLAVPICCGGLLAVIVAAFISSIVTTFTSATWTLAYREMTGLAAQPVAEPVAEA